MITCPVTPFLWNIKIVTTHLMKKLVDIFIKSRLHEDTGDRVEDSLGHEAAVVGRNIIQTGRERKKKYL